MLKNSFVFLVYFFLLVFIHVVHNEPIRTFNEDEQLLMKAFPLNTFTNTISDCGDFNDILQIEYIRISPDPPLKGQQLNIDAAGFLRETIEQGSYIHLTVKMGLIKLLEKTFDFCEESVKVNKPCPVERGRQILKHTVDIPKKIPPGKYTVDAQVYTPDNRRITCLKAVAIFRP